MATGFTIWGTNQKQKAWAKDVIYEAIKTSSISRFTGSGPNNIIQKRTELQKVKGDRIYFDLFIEMSAAPRTGNDEMTGNEEQITSYQDDVLLDRTRNSFKKYGRLDDMYSQKNMLTIGKDVLKQYFANLMNEYSMKWLCGNTSLSWPETVTTFASSRVKFANDGTGSTWQGTDDLGTADTFGVDEIVFMKYHAVQADPKFRPLEIEGGKHYVMFIHPRHEFNLKKDSDWLQAQREGNIRGSSNPIFSGALGMYDGVLLYMDEHLITGDSNTNARAIICGQQAGMMAMGKGPVATYEVSDHENRHSVGLDLVWGLKRSVFNSVDFSVMAIDCYATAPSTPAS